MDPDTADWYGRAVTGALRPLGDAEARFQVAYRHRKRADIAGACDQLSQASAGAGSWFATNPCPDPNLSGHLMGQVSACEGLAVAITSSAWAIGDERIMSQVDFKVADLQHTLLWHRDAIASWARGN